MRGDRTSKLAPYTAEILKAMAADPKPTLKSLATKYGVCHASVSRLLKALGYEAGFRRLPNIDGHNLARMRKMYRDGNSIQRISQITGYSVGAISRKFNREGIAKQRNADFQQAVEAACAAIQAEGLTHSEAAARFNISIHKLKYSIYREKKKEKGECR